MEARVQVVGDVFFVELVGRIGYDVVDHFRRICLEKWSHHKLVLDMKGLAFVGSHGISDFVTVLEDLSKVENTTVKFCGVGSEFKRILQVSQIKDLQMFDSLDRAVASFQAIPQHIIEG